MARPGGLKVGPLPDLALWTRRHWWCIIVNFSLWTALHPSSKLHFISFVDYVLFYLLLCVLGLSWWLYFAAFCQHLIKHVMMMMMMMIIIIIIIIIIISYRITCRHVVFAPSVYNSYAGTTFPSLVDNLFELQQSSGDSDAAWRTVEEQLSIVTFLIDTATATLAPPSEF